MLCGASIIFFWGEAPNKSFYNSNDNNSAGLNLKLHSKKPGLTDTLSEGHLVNVYSKIVNQMRGQMSNKSLILVRNISLLLYFDKCTKLLFDL